MLIKFTKMQGLGNDFVVIDAVTQNMRISASIVSRLADRKMGIGCDQLLIIEPPSDPDIDFNYRIFNRDGSEVEQCGNGARCVARYIHDRQLSGKKLLRVKTMNRVMTLRLGKHKSVTVESGIPLFEPTDIPFQAEQKAQLYPIDVDGKTYQIATVSVGNPHAVLQVDDVHKAPVEDLGHKLESHCRFPNRVNVGFMQIVNRQNIRLRVFERGVGETQACGSGACAAAAVAIQQKLVDSQVTVALPGGELTIAWRDEAESIIMTGPATSVFRGQIQI